MGSVRTEVVDVPLSHCKIIFYTPDNNPALPGHAQGEELIDPCVLPKYRPDTGTDPIRSCGFSIEHPDIDPLLVRSIELKMDYSNAEMAWVRVEMFVGKKIEKNA